MRYLKSVVLHPLLFAIFPPISLAAANTEWTFPDEAIVPTLLCFLIAILLWFAANLFLKNPAKSGLSVSLFYLFFFSFTALESTLVELHFMPGLILPAYLLLWFVSQIFILKIKDPDGELNSALNLVSIFLVACNLSFLSGSLWRDLPVIEGLWKENLPPLAAKAAPADAPDIFYVILDGMASPKTLKAKFNYDNQQYIDDLKKKGFYVPTDSHSNYPITALSLASSLNLRHHRDYLSYRSDLIPAEMIHKNRLAQLLKSRGYKFIDICSGFSPTDNMPQADLLFRSSNLSSFDVVLLYRSILQGFEPYTGFMQNNSRKTRLNFFEHIKQIKQIEGPKFVLAHVVLPHPPFLFDRNGSFKSDKYFFLYNIDWPKAPYLEQVIFVENKVKAMLEELLPAAKRPLVMVIQADHGPLLLPEKGREAKADMFETRMSIFNAYYFSDAQYGRLYNTVTPVNSFRIILNQYLGEKFQMLPDLSIWR
ncbi:MAG: LTA synthase family protein [Candidatus Obscuribacterales bacterium]|nr:LTA synthase family protein [Candidatus Obscuribacterales bacterium]